MRARATVAGALGLLVAASAGPAGAGRIVDYATGYPPGAVVISQSAKRLYLILDARTAIAYPVAVAKRGKEWSGPARVAGKFVEPAWSPPDSVKRDLLASSGGQDQIGSGRDHVSRRDDPVPGGLP